MFEVELDIFSGRPNPRWSLEPAEERELLTRVLDRSVPVVGVMDTDGHLGYRGFIVRATGATAQALQAQGRPTAFRVRDGLRHQIDLSAESWLLKTAIPDSIPGQAVAAARTGVASSADSLTACKPHMTSTTNFDKWNNGAWVGRNNCYNYGSNYRTDTFAQPGRGTGEMYHAITVDEIYAAAKRDGYTDECAGGKTLYVGFAIWPGSDYHWWRRTKPMDGEQRWCHKPGGTPARNYDSSGHYITDPSKADRGPYTIWGHFLYFKGKFNDVVR
jgi:hypothetical protein